MGYIRIMSAFSFWLFLSRAFFVLNGCVHNTYSILYHLVLKNTTIVSHLWGVKFVCCFMVQVSFCGSNDVARPKMTATDLAALDPELAELAVELDPNAPRLPEYPTDANGDRIDTPGWRNADDITKLAHQSDTALIAAVRDCSDTALAGIEALLADKVNVNEADRQGFTPLMLVRNRCPCNPLWQRGRQEPPNQHKAPKMRPHSIVENVATSGLTR